MNFVNRFFAIIISLSLLILILYLIKRKKLKEKYSILWLTTGIIIFLFAIFEKLLKWLTFLFGIHLPINILFFLGIFFIVLINLHFSIVISRLDGENKKLAQKIALLEKKDSEG